MDLSTFKLGPITGATALVVVIVVAIALALLVAAVIIAIVKGKKEDKDMQEELSEREFFAQYGVLPEEVRLNQRITAYKGVKDKNMIDYKGDDLGTEPEEQAAPVEDLPEEAPVEEPAEEEKFEEMSLDEFGFNEETPAAEEAPVEELPPVEEPAPEPLVEEPLPELEPAVEEPAPEPEPIPEPEPEPVVEEPAPEPEPIPEPEPVPEPVTEKPEEVIEEEKVGVEKPATKKVVKKKPDDWSKYDGEYEGYYYDPEDACYYEGKPSAALAKKLEAKKAEIEAQNMKSGKKVVIKKVAPPFATLKTPKHERKDPEKVSGFDEAKIYGKYVIENADGEWYYSLYSNTDERLYESGNYSSLEFCQRAIQRFKTHALIGTYTIEADGDKFCAVIKRKTYVHKGNGRDTFAEAEKHMNQIKDFAQTDIIREQ